MKKFIVITSINPPSEAVYKFAAMKDYSLIVVGDKKTPADWECENVTYLSTGDQVGLAYKTLKTLPFNSYSRKMVGYLYAINSGADVIIDSDDDNTPYKGWGFPGFAGEYMTIRDNCGFQNIYSYFTIQPIWPRGYPLKRVTSPGLTPVSKKYSNVGIWNGLVNGEPDVDAIYRLTNNAPCQFKGTNSIVLGQNTVCPFNSQNTAFRKELFPLLYLPAFVTIRATDIWRGYIAQILMWQYGYRLGFAPANAYQVRNPHDYLKDLEHEIPVYLQTEKLIEVVRGAIREKASIYDNLVNSYVSLSEVGIVEEGEVGLVINWVADLKEMLK